MQILSSAKTAISLSRRTVLVRGVRRALLPQELPGIDLFR
jgi:hypothetical protein